MAEAVTLENFNEKEAKCRLNSPRSLQACRQEGVLPEELTYKSMDMFQERNLSPRLVKLRYDFFEAKRRDLLAATRRARDTLCAEEKREKESVNQQLDVISKECGLSRGAILALNSDGLKQERKKLLKAQENERKWLQNALSNELHGLMLLENNNKSLTEASNDAAEKTREAARKMKEMNDKRAAEEERKTLEAEARMKLEKQIAKEEFHKQQKDLEKKAELEAIKQREAYERQCRETERKKQAEIEKEKRKEAACQEQEARKNELRAQDLRRMEIMDNQKQAYQLAMRQKQDSRDARIFQSIQANLEIEQKRRDDFELRQVNEMEREERLMQARALDQEESAKRSFQQMMKRKMIKEESERKAEDHRMAILKNQDETEMRLLEHEQKKERYLDFKRELDMLRGKNKEINVERQRRKEEAHRENVAEGVRRKDEKIDCLTSERNRLWQIRRAAQSEAYRAREVVKNEVMKQRVASKFDSKALDSKLSKLMKHELFTPKILHTSSSAPLLASMQASQNSRGSEQFDDSEF